MWPHERPEAHFTSHYRLLLDQHVRSNTWYLHKKKRGTQPDLCHGGLLYIGVEAFKI
jgi:hypothetical protein